MKSHVLTPARYNNNTPTINVSWSVHDEESVSLTESLPSTTSISSGSSEFRLDSGGYRGQEDQDPEFRLGDDCGGSDQAPRNDLDPESEDPESEASSKDLEDHQESFEESSTEEENSGDGLSVDGITIEDNNEEQGASFLESTSESNSSSFSIGEISDQDLGCSPSVDVVGTEFVEPRWTIDSFSEVGVS
eukprot:sb/3471167/